MGDVGLIGLDDFEAAPRLETRGLFNETTGVLNGV
jgi:hypothetical protein